MEVLVVSILFLVATLAQAGAPQTINLPADAEVVTIVGNGFRLNVTQVAKMQSNWKAVADELDKEKQEGQKIEEESENNNWPQVDDGSAPTTDAPPDRVEPANGGVNRDGYNGLNDAGSSDQEDYGFLDADLHTWIEDRATALADRVERYSWEINTLKNGPRLVSQILLLNTLYDLETLNKENIKSLKWIKNKLRWIMATQGGVSHEVSSWVASKIKEARLIEDKVKGGKGPGIKWLTNVQAIKRIQHEQRFSEPITEVIDEFLGDEFNMMKRSIVYDQTKPAKILDDGLYYYQAKGRIPAYFPFFSQDSIINGVYL